MYYLKSLIPTTWRSRIVATLLVATSICFTTRAQQAPTTIRLQSEDLQRGLNGHQHNFYFLPPGVTGENYLSAGFFGQKLRPFLGTNVESLSNLDRYKQQKTAFLVDRLVAVGSFGVYGSQIFSGTERQYFNGTQRVAAGVFVTSVLATIFINRNTNSYLQRAVGSYNAAPGHGAWWPRLRPSGLEIGQAPTGAALLGLRWAVR